MSEIELGELIDRVRETESDPLGRVESAVALAESMDAVADHLIRHFVAEARSDGLSWTQIGDRLGVSKQAVRKRFIPEGEVGIFARYNESARHVIVLARDYARNLHHPAISAGHLLLALSAKRVVRGKAIELDLGEPSPEIPEQLPFTEDAKTALGQAIRAAGGDQVGPEHLAQVLTEEPR
jgi:hypothetical protein